MRQTPMNRWENLLNWGAAVVIALLLAYAVGLSDRDAVSAAGYRRCSDPAGECDPACPRGTLLKALCPVETPNDQ